MFVRTLYAFSAVKPKAKDAAEKLCKGWLYLLKESKKEQPLDNMKQFTQRRAEELQGRYMYGFTHDELKNEALPLQRAFSINNATPSLQLQERAREAIEKFQSHENDNGGLAVQAAMLSEKVVHQMLHLEQYRKDTVATRSLIQRLTKRRKALNWLKRKDYHMYRWIIKEYGIEDIKYPNHKESFYFQAKRRPV